MSSAKIIVHTIEFSFSRFFFIKSNLDSIILNFLFFIMSIKLFPSQRAFLCHSVCICFRASSLKFLYLLYPFKIREPCNPLCTFCLKRTQNLQKPPLAISEYANQGEYVWSHFVSKTSIFSYFLEIVVFIWNPCIYKSLIFFSEEIFEV